MKTFEAVLLVFLTHINHGLVMGFIFTNGIYQVVFLETFTRGATVTSWVSSVQMGMLCFTGPIASMLIGHFGTGVTITLGGLIASLGVGSSAFTTGVEQLIVTFGFISGAGFSLVFTGSICVIPDKFTTYRIVASGVSMSGAGVGTVLWSWLSRYMLTELGWRSTLLLSSGLTLQMCVSGAVINLYCNKTAATTETNDVTTSQNNTFTSRDVKLRNLTLDNIRNSELLIPQHRSLDNLKQCTTYLNPHLTDKRTWSQNDVTGKRHAMTSSLLNVKNSLTSSAAGLGYSMTSLHELYASMKTENNNNVKNDQKSEGEKRSPIRTVLDTTRDIVTDWNFLLLSLNVLLFCFGLSVVYTHIAAYCQAVGRGPGEVNAVLSTLGVSNLLGRILLSVISNQCRCLHIVFLYSSSYCLSGLGTLLMVFWPQVEGLITCAAGIGFFTGAFAGVLTELTCLLLGASRFYITYGYLLVFMGVGFMLGGPTAGFAYDYFQNYQGSLFIGTGAFVISSLVILPTYVSLR